MLVDTLIRNIVKLADGDFDCEIFHPVFGWIPFTASSRDPEPHGRAIFKKIEDR